MSPTLLALSVVMGEKDGVPTYMLVPTVEEAYTVQGPVIMGHPLHLSTCHTATASATCGRWGL